MGGLFGADAPQTYNPMSPEAIALRHDEMVHQKEMAREEAAYQRQMAMEDREWQEDLESSRALRKQKEEEERIRALRDEQSNINEEVAEQIAEGQQDVDQQYTQMWSSLSNGVTSGDRTSQAHTTPARSKKRMDSAFSSFLRGEL